MSLVVGQEQAPPIPEFRQYQFHELTPEIPNRNGLPCESIDVQFPAQPCSPIRSLPILDYIPPYHAVPMIPQAVPRPVFTPSNDLVTDYNRYPSASVKQAEGNFTIF